MRIKIMAGVTALALAVSSVLAASPADARPWHHHWHHGGGGAFGGFAAGALLGGALASRPYYYGPGYAYDDGPDYAYEPAYTGGDAEAYCMSRFKSYDPGSGTYLGYDGDRHPCP
jgi:hypothetical protein